MAGKTTDYGDAVIERISGFLGYKGFKAFPVKGYYELEKVCPKLSGNVWLRDHCANKNHNVLNPFIPDRQEPTVLQRFSAW